jgi:hypothetical protein
VEEELHRGVLGQGCQVDPLPRLPWWERGQRQGRHHELVFSTQVQHFAAGDQQFHCRAGFQ